MLQIKKFDNGKPSWELKASAIVIGVIALVVIALTLGVDTSASIVSLFRR
jgi:hypothetical protein